MDCFIEWFLIIGQMFYRSFIAVSLLLDLSDAFSFNCNVELRNCTLNHWNPDEEGVFVLQHVPVNNSVLQVVDFLSPTIDARLFDELHSFSSVEICTSANVIRLILPESSTITGLTLHKTRLSWAYFEENYFLEHLSITDSPLNVVFPSVKNLKHLKELKLRKTGIANISIDWVCNELKQLEVLEIDQNQINIIVGPGDVQCSSGLKTFLMRNNRLRYVNLHDFDPFTKLLDLNIAYNQIESVIGRLETVTLNHLGLAGNRLQSIDFCHWAEMSNMSEVSIAYNKLVRMPTCLYTFPNVVMLYLQANQITSVNMEELVTLHSLRVLNLAANKIHSAHFRAAAFPPKLVQLFLYDNCMCNLMVSNKKLVPYTNLTIYLNKLYGNVLNINEFQCKTC